MQWQIVPMAAGHIPALAQIEGLCFCAPWSSAALAAELENGAAHFLVALGGGQPAGYVGLYLLEGEASIANVAVHPDWRRQGAGRQLVLEACRQAALGGAGTITLEVRASNQGAIRLYEGCGFSVLGRRRGLYDRPREDGLVMGRPLAAAPAGKGGQA